MLQKGDVIDGKYRILKIIGNGGMSVVYQAEDIKSGKQYAIKDVARDGRDSKNNMVIQSLAMEGNLLKQLSNPHLPVIYDILETWKSFMLVMDYVEGQSLDKVIKKRGAQPEQNIYDWGIQLCDVLDYLHSQTPPVIYRDMKPANIILQPSGNIVLIDFGTARTEKLGEELSSDTICIGTAGFAAPEQYGGFGQSDARTDIYCLGATLYNLLTGHSPCEPPEGIMPLEYFDASFADSPFDQIIRKCTQGIPGLRYQTAAELRAELERARTGMFKVKGNYEQETWIWQKLKKAGEDTTGLSGLLPWGRDPSIAINSSEAISTPKIPARFKSVRDIYELQRNPRLQKIMITLVISAVIFLTVSAVFVWLGGRRPALIALGCALTAIVSAFVSLLVMYYPMKFKHTDR